MFLFASVATASVGQSCCVACARALGTLCGLLQGSSEEELERQLDKLMTIFRCDSLARKP